MRSKLKQPGRIFEVLNVLKTDIYRAGYSLSGRRDCCQSFCVIVLFVTNRADFSPLASNFCLLLYLKKQRISSDTDLVRRVDESGSQRYQRLRDFSSLSLFYTHHYTYRKNA